MENSERDGNTRPPDLSLMILGQWTAVVKFCAFCLGLFYGLPPTLAESACKLLQSCPTLCNPMDCGLPGSSVHRILRQEYCSGLLYPPPGDFPDPGIEPESPASPELAGRFFTTEPPGKPRLNFTHLLNRKIVSSFNLPFVFD